MIRSCKDGNSTVLGRNCFLLRLSKGVLLLLLMLQYTVLTVQSQQDVFVFLAWSGTQDAMRLCDASVSPSFVSDRWRFT
jgi:hypothetical protein